MLKQRKTQVFLAALLVFVLAVAVYQLPFVKARVNSAFDEMRRDVTYFFRPPDAAVFQPAQATRILPTAVVITSTLAVTSTPEPSATPGPTLPPTATPTPLPAAVSLPGVQYVDQHNRWNYCAPANLVMSLKFWGWKGLPGDTRDLRDQVASFIKPGVQDPSLDFIQQGKTDKNVMPSEMAAFINNQTDLRALIRYGGSLELVKSLLAAGFPVVIEKGYFERDANGKISWLGHYLFVTGYDDGQRGFIVQDSYTKPGKNIISKYEDFQIGWRAFNYLFMVVYPPDREADLFAVLGPWLDSAWANQRALEVSEAEIPTLEGIHLFFAWFNKGTSLVSLYDYANAAAAFDQAFSVYATLGQDDKQRPYRMMWYQTSPYKAYYYSGRYTDVINLADTTFKTIDKPTLEESLFWRAMAYDALGDRAAAIRDMREAVRLNYRFRDGLDMLNQWGVQP
jgi:tetratricopeptide (TPR) repeat protein